MTMWQGIGICGAMLVSAIILFWKSTIGKYGEKSGELLALKHNIDLILDEQKKTTVLTETIKTEISYKSIAKQKHEDMKRETALEIMRAFGSLREAAISLSGAMASMHRLQRQVVPSPEAGAKVQSSYDDAQKLQQAGMTKFWQLQQIAKLVFSNAVYEKSEEVRKAFIRFMGGVYADDRNFEGLMDAVNARQDELLVAIRAELGIE